MIRFAIGAAAALALLAMTAGGAFARDNNPPGPRGGPGTNWENPPGPIGGPGTSPDVHPWGFWGGHYWWHHEGRWLRWNPAIRCWAKDFDGNPPGPRGGRGTNWENPPGLAGGVGASPDRWGRCR